MKQIFYLFFLAVALEKLFSTSGERKYSWFNQFVITFLLYLAFVK